MDRLTIEPNKEPSQRLRVLFHDLFGGCGDPESEGAQKAVFHLASCQSAGRRLAGAKAGGGLWLIVAGLAFV
jgi:hypothetical protein